MSITEEIEILQFGQGILSEADVLSSFSKLSEDKKKWRIYFFRSLLQRVKPNEAEVEQVNPRPAPEDPTNPTLVMYTPLKNLRGLRLNMSCDELDNSYRILLNLFRTAYQRTFELEKDNPNIWHRELSDPETVAGILADYQALVDALYSDSGFRTEFISIARLWHANHRQRQVKMDKPALAVQTHYHFVTYEQMSTGLIEDNKNTRASALLRSSVAKALIVRYKLDQAQAGQLLNDVLERHLRETYNTDLDGQRTA